MCYLETVKLVFHGNELRWIRNKLYTRNKIDKSYDTSVQQVCLHPNYDAKLRRTIGAGLKFAVMF